MEEGEKMENEKIDNETFKNLLKIHFPLKKYIIIMDL